MNRKRKTKEPCDKCFLHIDHCICEHLKKIDLATRVDLIVHYKELKRTTNTGRLISELLERQKIWIRGLEDTPLDHSLILDPSYQALLLYPADDAMELTGEFMASLPSDRPIQLLVPDGNWRQASKVHYRVEELKGVQRVKLPEKLADRENLVRKESKPAGMSTLESIGHALGVLEGECVKEHILGGYQRKKEATLKARGEK